MLSWPFSNEFFPMPQKNPTNLLFCFRFLNENLGDQCCHPTNSMMVISFCVYFSSAHVLEQTNLVTICTFYF